MAHSIKDKLNDLIDDLLDESNNDIHSAYKRQLACSMVKDLMFIKSDLILFLNIESEPPPDLNPPEEIDHSPECNCMFCKK